jgi:hypothetical protein
MILLHNISITPHGPECNYSSFCSNFHKLSEYCNLEITCLGQTGILSDSKDNTIYCMVTVSQIFVKNLRFWPQNDQTNTQTVFGASEMITCKIDNEKIHKDLRYW